MYRKLTPLCAIAGFALATSPVHATTTFEGGFSGTATEIFSTAQFAYAADVSNSDLINGMIPTVVLANWNTTNEAHPNELTDGIHGVGFQVAPGDRVQGAWTKTNVSAATYNLGLGANNLGYDITSIQSIADWVNVGFGNQAWMIEVKPVGGSYSTLANVNYQPLGKVAPNDIGTTKVTLSNLDATGIESIRITSISVNGGTNAGAFVWRELDVFGTATVAAIDETPPVVSTLSPSNGATGVPVGANLVVTFNENIALGTGDITIKDLDTPAETVITLPDARVSVSGAVLTINPTANLSANTDFSIQIAAGAITDLAGNPFAGIADDTTWNFTTGEPPAEEFSLTQYSYTADVSSSDLLHGLTPVTTGWNTSNQASPLDLTDGVHGGAFQALPADWVQGAWTTVGATAEYHLDLGTSAAGYDIISVQSIADWVGSGFGNQAWTIEVRSVGGSYGTLATVNYQPLGGAQGGATKVTLTDPSGILASGIGSIKVTADQVNGGANAGAFIWRELDVFGVPSNDETPPTIISLSPADGTTGVLPSGNLVATFGENIVLGSGTITIKDLDTPAQTLVITLPDARVSVSGAALTINPATDLAAGTHYAVQIDATAIDDVSGNPFAGIADDTTWDFTTGVPDLLSPALASLNPADDDTNVPLAADLVATFNESIALGTGSITIKNLDTLSQTVITLPDARVAVSGAVLTINPSTNLATTTNYAVSIDSGAVTDLSGNPFGGINDDTTWNFRTASAPLRIMCMGDSITTGYTDNPSWTNHPFMFGYRSGLYTRLTNASYNFLFVGGSTEPWTGISGDPTHGGTYKPALDLRDFGQDGHRGYGGKTASYLNSNILNWLASDNPDVILLKIGTNSQDQSGLNTLVNTITTTKPDCHLIIAQIMPKYSYQSGIVTYNTYIRNTLVPNYQAQGKKVSVVDQYAPFLTNPAVLTSIDTSLFSNGINHPDNDGYDKMAQVWFDAIEALRIGPNTFAKWITDPAFGIAPGQQGLDQDPDGDGILNGIENFFGTDPGTCSQGLVADAVNAGGDTFTFTHPLNPAPADNLTATYQWSNDLATFTADGNPFDGTTVTFTRGTPSAGFVPVTATVTGTPRDRLFVRVAVTQD